MAAAIDKGWQEKEVLHTMQLSYWKTMIAMTYVSIEEQCTFWNKLLYSVKDQIVN